MKKLFFGFTAILLLAAVAFIQADAQIRAEGVVPVLSPAEGLGLAVIGGIVSLLGIILILRFVVNPTFGKKLLKK